MLGKEREFAINIPDTPGKLLTSLRRNASMSGQQLGEAAEIDPAHISRAQRDQPGKSLSVSSARRVAQVLGAEAQHALALTLMAQGVPAEEVRAELRALIDGAIDAIAPGPLARRLKERVVVNHDFDPSALPDTSGVEDAPGMRRQLRRRIHIPVRARIVSTIETRIADATYPNRLPG